MDTKWVNRISENLTVREMMYWERMGYVQSNFNVL